MKKTVYVILAVFLVLALFAGAGAASFTVSPDKAKVNPSGPLSPGDTVSAVVQVDIPDHTNALLTLTTPLTGAVWHLDVIRGGQTITAADYRGAIPAISDYLLHYDEPLSVKITLTGTVDQNSKGKQITVMSITQSGGSNAGTTYATPAQSVYNPDELDANIASARKTIANLKPQLIFYSNAGIDVTKATDDIASAENYLNTAQTYGKTKLEAAFKALSNAEGAIKSASRSLDNAALSSISVNITATEGIINELIEKGKTNEAALLSSNLQDLKSEYMLLKTEYDQGNAPDCTAAFNKSLEVKAKADDYLEKANSIPAILQYWWVLLIVLGVAAVVVGAVFLIRRRGGGWDELG